MANPHKTIVVTRRRWDIFFFPVLVIFVLVGAYAAWLAPPSSFAALLFPVPLVALWLFMRFTTPRVGRETYTLLGQPGNP